LAGEAELYDVQFGNLIWLHAFAGAVGSAFPIPAFCGACVDCWRLWLPESRSSSRLALQSSCSRTHQPQARFCALWTFTRFGHLDTSWTPNQPKYVLFLPSEVGSAFADIILLRWRLPAGLPILCQQQFAAAP